MPRGTPFSIASSTEESPESDPECQAAVGHLEVDDVVEVFPQQLREGVAPGKINLQRLARMAMEFARLDQFGHRQFRRYIALPIDDDRLVRHHADDVGSGGDITDPQARQQEFRHRADIDRPARRITCHRQQRLLLEMKLVVVVILDYGEAELTCQIQQPQSPLRRERNGCRKLMMRRQVKSADLVLAAKPSTSATSNPLSSSFAPTTDAPAARNACQAGE